MTIKIRAGGRKKVSDPRLYLYTPVEALRTSVTRLAPDEAERKTSSCVYV